MPGGRPSKYDKVDEKLLKKLYEAGLTDAQVANVIGVNRDTIFEWKKKHPEFSDTIKRGKGISDDKVEKSLFERATGYSHPDIHITNYQGTITKTKITKHYAPDPTSMIFWLKNRKPGEWRDKQEIDFTKPLEVVITDYRGKQD